MSKDKRRQAGERLKTAALWLRGVLGLYLDDLLFTAGGACFVVAAASCLGFDGALAVAGVWLTVSAVLVARSKGGGKP